jgi:pectin methylesterase-like acyl-CoA thioesterase
LNHCKLRQDAGVTGNVFLGRPWRPFATVIYLHTEMGDKIDPAGWREWHPGETHSLETAFYAEFDSSGPGVHPKERDSRTHFLTADEARQYEPAEYLRGSDNWNATELPKLPAQ